MQNTEKICANIKHLTDEINEALKNKPEWSREGQFVFNYIDEHYGVARAVQFDDEVDCYYDDNQINEFIVACAKRI